MDMDNNAKCKMHKQTNQHGENGKVHIHNPKSLYPPIKINISSYCFTGMMGKPQNRETASSSLKAAAWGKSITSYHYAWSTFSSHSFAPTALM
jgi:hypothetical protein